MTSPMREDPYLVPALQEKVNNNEEQIKFLIDKLEEQQATQKK
jgi:hypothetical protein